jgi:hypothetical protein
MQIPSNQRAFDYLREAEGMNPGPWVSHSQHVAQAASNIAKHHPVMNPDHAFILGLLHDIGRREGVYGMRHVVDGYTYMMSEGYPDIAHISITHSYPIPNVMVGSSEWDGTEEEREFVADYLATHPYTDYDRLIQLCDSICMSEGPVLMEKRFVDVTMRYGFNSYTIEKWRAFFDIKDSIERLIGHSIYDYLDGVIKNTFRTEL